jgi:transposase InsO family protein
LKLKVLQELNAGTAVADVSRAFGLALTTIALWRRAYATGGYEALFPKKAGRTAQGKGADDPRREAVLAMKKAHPEYGTRRIRDVLKRFEALPIGESEVRRMLHEANLMDAPAKRPRPEPEPRRFERAEPNQLWQSDIFTFLLRRHERVYLCAFMDDHSRFIVGWAMARHQKEFLVRDALEWAHAKYGVPKEILTDNGRQYTAWRGTTKFEEELRRQGIRHIKSRPQHPQTLGKIERFWKTLWDEFLSRTVFASFEDCASRLTLFVDGYNYQRPHQALEGLTPADRYFRAAVQVRAAMEAQLKANSIRLAQQQAPQKPFYMVGKFGEHEMTISAVRDGVRVQLGKEAPQTISLSQEVANAQSIEEAKEPAAPDAEVAAQEAGTGRGRAAPDADDSQRAERRDAGDGRDHPGADLEGTLLPAGGAGFECGPRSHGAGSVARTAAGDDDAALAAGGEGEAVGDRQAPAGEVALDDAQSAATGPDEDGPGPAEISEGWEERFAALDAGGEDEPRVRLSDLVERAEHPLTWPRKLAGSEAASEAVAGVADEHLYDPTETAAGDRGSIRNDLANAQWSDDGDGRGGEAESVAGAMPYADESGGGWSAGSAAAEEAWSAGDAGAGAEAAGGGGDAAAGEQAPGREGGDDRPTDDGGGRDPARPGTDDADEKEKDRERQQ